MHKALGKPKRMSAKFLGSLKRFVLKNRQFFIGLAIGVVVATPLVLYMQELKNNNSLLSQNLAQATARSPELTASNVDTTKTSTGSESNTQSQNTQLNATPNGASRSTSSLSTNSNSTTSTPKPSAAAAPTPASTPVPTPIELATCMWQNGPLIGHNCPYAPPPSWSTDYVKYSCEHYSTSELIPCPSYREFTGINAQGYSIDTRGLCQFTITSKYIHRNVIVSKPEGSGSPDCSTAIPL